jgi:hypothetical protein
LVHEPSSRVNYRIELRTIHELARVIVSPSCIRTFEKILLIKETHL